MVFKLRRTETRYATGFENDVKMYGIQTSPLAPHCLEQFENDVKMYGIQTKNHQKLGYGRFENDVKMYGIQTEQ